MKIINIISKKIGYLFLCSYYALPQILFAQHATDSLKGYLFAYFEGSGEKAVQEPLRFACSHDALQWTALNENKPIVSSASISSTGGIRDPHILRGEIQAIIIW